MANRFYVGHTANIQKRLSQHNNGSVKSTKAYKPWEAVYVEYYNTKQEAYKRELQIKSYKGGSAFQKIIQS